MYIHICYICLCSTHVAVCEVFGVADGARRRRFRHPIPFDHQAAYVRTHTLGLRVNTKTANTLGFTSGSLRTYTHVGVKG